MFVYDFATGRTSEIKKGDELGMRRFYKQYDFGTDRLEGLGTDEYGTQFFLHNDSGVVVAPDGIALASAVQGAREALKAAGRL